MSTPLVHISIRLLKTMDEPSSQINASLMFMQAQGVMAVYPSYERSSLLLDQQMEETEAVVGISIYKQCEGKQACISEHDVVSSKPVEERMAKERVRVGSEAKMSWFKSR